MANFAVLADKKLNIIGKTGFEHVYFSFFLLLDIFKNIKKQVTFKIIWVSGSQGLTLHGKLLLINIIFFKYEPSIFGFTGFLKSNLSWFPK